MNTSRKVGLTFVCLWFFIGGIAHFAAMDLEMKIVPPYLGAPRTLVIVSGILELLGSGGLLLRPARRAAGIGLMLLTVAVTPANVYMLQRSDLFDIPYWILVARLPLQAALLLVIGWSAGVFWRDQVVTRVP